MHPVLEEILRAKLPIRPDVFRRWQQTILRDLATLDAPQPAKKGEAA